MNYNYDSSLLKKVSRSFYLTIRILPRTLRYPISIAYMLGRTADTITDTNIVADSNKLELITSLHKIISTKNPNGFNIFHQKIKDFENELSNEKILLNKEENKEKERENISNGTIPSLVLIILD